MNQRTVVPSRSEGSKDNEEKGLDTKSPVWALSLAGIAVLRIRRLQPDEFPSPTYSADQANHRIKVRYCDIFNKNTIQYCNITAYANVRAII